MPTYEYACRDCGHRLEAVQSFSDDALTVCPECDGELRKVFSAAGIIFKGSGYYVTDSRKATGDGAPSTTGAPSSGASEGGSGSGSGGGSGGGSGSGSGGDGGGTKTSDAGSSSGSASTSSSGSSGGSD